MKLHDIHRQMCKNIECRTLILFKEADLLRDIARNAAWWNPGILVSVIRALGMT
jgi:hypothetical protein